MSHVDADSPYAPDPAPIHPPPAEDRGRSLAELVGAGRAQRDAAASDEGPVSLTLEERLGRQEWDVTDDGNDALELMRAIPAGDLYKIASRIARICHEANRAYCATQGDKSQEAWGNAPQWQVDSAKEGVLKILRGEITTPAQSHESWLAAKRAEGWVYGPVKDAATKTHPCVLSYDLLPPAQRLKDELFFNIVYACTPELTRERQRQLPRTYNERNRVVAAFARLATAMQWPVVVTKTAIEGWDPAWHNCLFIATPEGQVSWHFHDRELPLFETFTTHTGVEWDGHTTPEKYERLARMVATDPAELVAETAIARDRVLEWIHEQLGLTLGDDTTPRIQHLIQAENELEIERMRCAACLGAAEGATPDTSMKPGSRYWTPAYQRVLDLRRERDEFDRIQQCPIDAKPKVDVLWRSLEALRLELPASVADAHFTIVSDAVNALVGAAVVERRRAEDLDAHIKGALT